VNRNLASKEEFLLEKPRGGDVRVIVCYPNRYWVAMSNLGFQTVYRLFSEYSRLNVERAYVPETQEKTWRTFETGSLLTSAEILAISVSFETDYPYLIHLVEQAGKFDNNNLVNRPLILGGGAALTLNPEPAANFFDAIVIGEGEEVIDEIYDSYISLRDKRASYFEILKALANIEGVYVPLFYDVEYNQDNTIKRFIPNASVQPRVKRRYIKNLDNAPTHTIIKTPETEFKAMYMTETGRGCEVGCKFCVAGYMYRPTRKRSEEAVLKTLKLGLEKSDSIGFVGAAVSSHPAISRLARHVASSGKRAALSSIMSQRVTHELASSLSESEYKTVALAPEAGSEELRFRVGKRVCDEQIIDGVGMLAKEGIRNFKLYFIVGLPSESLYDVEKIISLVSLVRNKAHEEAAKQNNYKIAPKIILSVNPFIPKAWTPFQRHGFLGFSELDDRIKMVREGIRRLPNVDMKHESPKESYFQTLLSRGDRRVGDLLLWAHKQGVDWKFIAKNGSKLLLEGVPKADFYVHRNINPDEILPWEIVDLKIKRSLLEREYEKTFSEDVSPLIERARMELRL
jgi:radical SAM superfamily enzyme YgiQ (UPF0313 family)